MHKIKFKFERNVIIKSWYYYNQSESERGLLSDDGNRDETGSDDLRDELLSDEGSFGRP